MSDGKIALVTGASRGIGKAIALDLAKQGYKVIGTATTDIGATKISTYLESASFKGKGLKANVACDESVKALYESIIASYGPPGVLVNNAGITRDSLLMRMKPEEWSEVIQTNLSSIFRVSRACIKAMTKARWGRIINISSVVGSSGNGGQTNYSASKAGIEGFTRSLAKEIGSRGITVNAVAPGFIETDMTRELPKQQAEALLAQIPLARLGQPEEIANMVGFLASDKGAYITGETLHVNGGMYMA
ncbi:3-oxoacyl-ACP reductase FabG [Gammaproteobacteria bacterium]|uniref:3-oxoacyl-[acyl-carrier-protein] reductase n=1 Tax=OM182 bacterium MED-G28 TaxID=1986256 RepID=A0A2A5WFH9_9GAMM|nr:3-oxoacyl-ACP reductase [Gammaproteobacteria bacterium]MDC0221782.1 3-oxoacyl-ACP reductase FabG [Gammaproteobacteria bacterium]PDH35182.1 MAG: 3-oxoacyl-ACP reductase [OM182 bacterium MED-G28]|tara:strand:- start:3348 stop:4088 length:741 start_codon:yes stop_codon:yes gene_type:complete